MHAKPSMDWNAYDAEISALTLQLGFTTASPADAPFRAWHRPGAGPRIYLSAGIHGDEPAGPLAVVEILQSPWFVETRADWTICPALNPHGLRVGTRENADGVDLNRDYQRRESTEVAAHAAWLTARPAPDLFLSLHEDWETAGFYFYEINLGPDDPSRAAAILTATSGILPTEISPVIDGHDVRTAGWIHHAAEADLPDAWPEAIFLAKNGCPLSFTFETPSQAPLEKRIAAHLAAVRAVVGSPML
ncbi:MAG: M14 family metallocarboxypeptidase [Luteolibacter sp.]|jgi:murein peptide amidase A